MNGRVDGVEEALVGVRCEVDGDASAGGDGSCDFNIQSDFSIGTVGVAGGCILCAIDRDSSCRDVIQAQLLPVGLEV